MGSVVVGVAAEWERIASPPPTVDGVVAPRNGNKLPAEAAVCKAHDLMDSSRPRVPSYAIGRDRGEE